MRGVLPGGLPQTASCEGGYAKESAVLDFRIVFKKWCLLMDLKLCSQGQLFLSFIFFVACGSWTGL